MNNLIFSQDEYLAKIRLKDGKKSRKRHGKKHDKNFLLQYLREKFIHRWIEWIYKTHISHVKDTLIIIIIISLIKMHSLNSPKQSLWKWSYCHQTRNP